MNEWMNELESLSRVWCFATPWIIACQASLSMEFSRQEYWSRLPFPSPGNLSDPGIEPGSPALQADYLLSEPQGKLKRNSLSPVRHFATLLTVVHGVLQARILEWVALSLLQWIFPNQELNEGSLHCRRILYQLSYQGSPMKEYMKTFHKSIMSK